MDETFFDFTSCLLLFKDKATLNITIAAVSYVKGLRDPFEWSDFSF